VSVETYSVVAVERTIYDFVIGKVLVDDDVTLVRTTPLFEGLLDSLGALQIASFLEESFSLRVIDGDLGPENFETIERLAAYVMRKTAYSR
jgi:acyl carrier protein